jgi:class 3 adenylate cyclase
MSEIRKWLEGIGLAQYADTFEANALDMDLLLQVDDQILKDIGVSAAGHRMRIRNAIAKLAPAPIAEVNLSPTAPKHETTAPSAERRQLTTMFCDLVGSTALSARLDPEDLRGVISAYHRRCTELVEHNGGFVAKYMGDGVLAYFGYPQAHEHDAERAVRAGLSLVDAVPKLATNAGSPLKVRIGIATGLVVVGDLIGAGAAQEQAVVGETPNLAARLQALAEPGAVVIASSTRRLTGGLFEYRDLGTATLKGFAENVPAWEVLGASAVESRFEAMRTAMTPLVGRDEEIELLLRRWEQVKRGDGQVVLISGEPGIGKSRIAETILERLSNEPHIRLRYFCSPHHQDSALYPSIAQLERAAGFRRDDTDEQRLNKLEAVLARAANDLSEAVPLLADLLSIPTGGRYPPLNLTPQKRKEKTLHAQLEQVEGLATQQPVLMVWEDVHWSDPTTREWLDLLVDRVPTLRVLVIITFRPEFAPPWVGGPQVTILTLNRLPPRQRAEMIPYVTGGKTLPREIADQIVDRTDGVPLFIEELTKTVVESGILTEVGNHYAVAGPVGQLAIPTSLHASLLARLDRLAPTREVAQIGSALGRSFSHELIVAVSAMPQDKLNDALHQLVTAELIFRRGTPPDAEYTFKHALVQDAAYSTLLRSRRQQLHARIAATLEHQFPDIVVAQPSLLAQHCASAGLNEKAVDYWLKAGQQSVARSAMAEAIAQLQNGLGLLASIEHAATRERCELGLRAALVPALVATKGYSASDVGENISLARTLAEQLGQLEYLIPLLYGEYTYHAVRAETRLGLACARQMEKLGAQRSDVVVSSLGHLYHGMARFILGEHIQARALLEQCHRLNEPASRAATVGVTAEDPYAMALCWHALTLTYLGYIDQGRARLNEAFSVPQALGQLFTEAFVLVFACWVAWATGSHEDQHRYADRLIALSNEHGFPYLWAIGLCYQGASMVASDRARNGLALIEKAFSTCRAIGAKFYTSGYLSLQAQAHIRLSEFDRALEELTEAQGFANEMDERFYEPEIYRLRGDLLSARGDASLSELAYQQALAVGRSQNTRLFELRAATRLARLWHDQGKRAEARDLLAPIYNWFTEGFDTLVLKEAKALLDELA